MEPKMLKRLAAAACGIVALVTATAVNAQTLDKIKQRGTLIVGVKNDYRPFGFLDPSGAIVGMEPDLAKDVANRLGVKLELVPVQSANRVEFLQQGRIDLMIATMSDSTQRRQTAGVVDPAYYAGGTAVLVPKSAHINKWEDLRGKNVCATQGAYYNRPVSEKYGANIMAFAATTEAQVALFGGSCIGFLQDSTLIAGLLASEDGKWSAYEMPLPVEDPQSWVIAVPLSERDGPFGHMMSDIIKDWHKSGKLIELEKKWKLEPSAFLKEEHAKSLK
jgi:polar amino acid transport system substrate-binding protein